VWNGVGQFLSFLGGMGPSLSFFPDHLQEDFTLGYLLYVRAFVRMTSSRFLPSFFACEGVETWHPDARRLTARLIKEFLPDSNFIPVLSSATEVVPEEFASFTVIPLCVHSLGKREIRSLSRRLFPGLEIPETEIHRIRQRTSGLCMPVISYLQYLFKTGKIRNAESRFQWVQSFEEESVLPANPLSVHWFLIRSLGDGIYLLLYALYLAAGLLDRKRLFQFLVEQGLERTDVERSLQTLIALGLVTDGDILVPRIPPLRRKLEELLGKEGERLRERLISHLYASWKKGEYPHRVLLFSFFARSGRTGLAVEVLPEVIRRKIDEGDLEGAGLFSDPRRLEFSVPPDAGQKETLKLISMTGRLRIALKDFRQERVEEIQIPARPVGADMDTEVAGDVALVRVLYRLAVGNSGSALEELKTALLEFQENGFERGERSAYHILGLTMMGEGRLGEAIEYLLLSERLHAEAADTLGALRSSSSLAVGYFLDGRLTQCLQTAERAETNAAAIGQREQELFARFLRARVCFQLGYYDECFTLLQQCLCDSVLYSMRGARVVLSAWLGRAMLYLGDVQSASRYLEKLEKSAEVFYFLAESSLFSHNLKNASRFAEQALESAGPSAFPPPEGVSWRDGFSSVEGRCFSLSRDNAFFRRGVRALTGCLLGMRGSAKEAIRELHRLTRGEEALGEDPGSYLHAYFYSLVLPELSTEEGDDKTTILSKSVKGLQGRASRIEAPAHKSAFLTASYWNRRIMEDARQRKLI
jgi:tetratricopeptide (TPR) repeat protein